MSKKSDYIYLQSVGLISSTLAIYKGKRIAIQGTDIKTIVHIWRLEFGIPDDVDIYLVCEKGLFTIMANHPIKGCKSVSELFGDERAFPIQIEDIRYVRYEQEEESR